MKVIVTGAKGMLGRELVPFLKEKGFLVGEWDLPEWDIRKKEVIAGIEQERPEGIIHLAAFTDVDGAEEKRREAYEINFLGTANLVAGAERISAKFLYLSTDYVFDGKKHTPYSEEDAPHPLNYYGETKYLGEMVVKKLKRFFILRTAWLYSREGKNFVNAIKGKIERGEEIRVVDDQIGSPTYTKDLSVPIADLIKSESYGIYHITNSGFCSWFQFAREIGRILGVNKEIKPIKTEEAGRLARRPRYSVLDNSKYQRIFGKNLRAWPEALRECLRGKV
ncbi:MAG: dTDP-4-dehydrorhamnose reductase [candidate division WOR-3 bacterium]